MTEFKYSNNFTIGIELEIQIINRDNHDLAALASDVMHQLKSPFNERIKPEITQSMLEINSSIHESPKNLLMELKEIRDYLVEQTQELNIYFSGGGTHPFQMWHDRKIYPEPKFKKAAHKYGYLAKMFTVFGLHIHIGCPSGNDAIYFTHALAQFVPQFIALSASSPFCQGIDTDFHSSRSNVINSFPLSGLPPVTSNWDEFCSYIKKMQNYKIIDRVDNFYWDIRPRPEFGTVELRICDAPLTIDKAVMLAAYAQTIARHVYFEKPLKPLDDNYHLYRYNCFQASRYGLNGAYINPYTNQHTTINEDILETSRHIEQHSLELGNDEFLLQLINAAKTKQNDAQWLKNHYINGKSLKNIVNIQSQVWAGKQEIETV